MIKDQTKIEKLISELCPHGVSYRELGKVAKYSKYRIDASALDHESYVGVDNLLQNKQGKTASNYVPKSGKLTQFNPGDILIGNIRPYLKKIWLSDCVGGTNGDVLAVEINDKQSLSPEFLYFLLSSDDFFNFDMKFSKGAKMPRGNKDAILKYKIPVPPLAIQDEIVKILNKFTELEAEIEAEIEARKKQYEYYKNKLLSTHDEANRKSIGEVTLPTSNIKWKESKKTYKYVDLTSVSRDDHNIYETKEIDAGNAPSRAQKIIQKNDVIFATTRPTLRRFALIDDNYDGQIASTGYCILKANKDKVLPKWLYFNIASKVFDKYVEKFQEGSAYPSISDSKVKEFIISVPPIEEQQKIISVLDKFDALVNDISIGLPAELNARRQQYEYYRNKLLTFNEYVE